METRQYRQSRHQRCPVCDSFVEVMPQLTSAQQAMLERIEAARSDAGGYTAKGLAELGIPWPPKKGWKQRLMSEAMAEATPAG